MTKTVCLTENDFTDLYYGEHADEESARSHLAQCPQCETMWKAFRTDLADLCDPVPSGGSRAIAGAKRALGLASEPGKRPSENSPGKEIWGSFERSGGTSGGLPGAVPGTVEMMTLTEVAEYLRVSLEQIRDMLSEIPHVNLGGVVRVRRKTLEAFLEKRESESVRRSREPGDLGLLRRNLI